MTSCAQKNYYCLCPSPNIIHIFWPQDSFSSLLNKLNTFLKNKIKNTYKWTDIPYSLQGRSSLEKFDVCIFCQKECNDIITPKFHHPRVKLPVIRDRCPNSCISDHAITKPCQWFGSVWDYTNPSLFFFFSHLNGLLYNPRLSGDFIDYRPWYYFVRSTHFRLRAYRCV